MGIQFWAGIGIGVIIASVVYVMAYIDLLKDIRREVERLREAQERIRSGQ